MDAIDIIFIIVCIVVPMVGKYIDKAAKKSLPGRPAIPEVDEAEDSPAEPVQPRRPYSAFPEEPVSTSVPGFDLSYQTEESGMRDDEYNMAMDFQEEGGRMPEKSKNASIAPEGAAAGQKERIDKRKLVIYSEIMKPKFDEQADY